MKNERERDNKAKSHFGEGKKTAEQSIILPFYNKIKNTILSD